MSTSGLHPGSRSTSRSLLQRVRTQDPAAWDRLVELYAPFVFQQCRRARLAPEDSADVFQEVFQAAFAKLDSFEKRKAGDTFRGWLCTITANKVRDHFRRLEREPRGVGGSEVKARLAEVQAPSDPAGDGTESGTGPVVAVSPERELFQRALQAIRPHFHERTWLAFEGTVLRGRTPKDVGEELSMAPGTVRVAKSRVLQRLRAELGDL